MSRRCPSCHTMVDDDATVCPNCPWIFPDEMETARAAQTVAAPWSPLPLVILAAAVLAVAGGWIVFMRGLGRESRENPVASAGGKAAAPSKTAEVEPQPAPELQTRSLEPAVPPAAPPAEPQAASAPAPSAKPAPQAQEWKLRGHIYDLMTLRPIPRCRIELSDLETGAHFETSTDDSGLYRAILPSLAGRGYSVRLTQAAYVPIYLDPETENVPQKPAGERRSLCRELATAVREPAALKPFGADPLVTDFYLAPLSCL